MTKKGFTTKTEVNMRGINLEKVELEKLGEELAKYEDRWIAISSDNMIVASGKTYREAVLDAGEIKDIILFKVPPLDVSLAPFSFSDEV